MPIFCFGYSRNGSKTSKQTEKLFFWFHKKDRNRTETDQVSVFGSNRDKKLFVSKTL